ncbi:MAG TPA: hypothetical protein VF121_03590 [Thermoanaerobaculia bacterium]|nr:hypothetical protein [Thermoanaerobaculia bacterium]
MRRRALLALLLLAGAGVGAWVWLARRAEPPSPPRPWRLSDALFERGSGFPLDPESAPPPPERVLIRPGEALHRRPRAGARTVTRFHAYGNLAVVDHRPGWVKVEYRGHSGWVPLSGEWEEPPLGSAPDPTLPLPALPADPERLAAARAALGAGAAEGRLGPYALVTDFADLERLAWLDRVAAGFESAYHVRYGLLPVGEPAETVVLFAEETAYRAFQSRDARLAGLPASGHTGHGLVALFDGGLRRAEVGGTLVHELTHLVNRRAIGPALPSWLDEGIADELAMSRLDEAGRLAPGTLGGAVVEEGFRRQLFGAPAALHRLARGLEEGRLRPLPELLDLDWAPFVAAAGARHHYPHAAFWVRYLLEGEDGALAPAFRAFLAGVAAGGSAAPEALRARLGRSWEELEAGFRTWVLALETSAPPGGSGDAGRR